MRKRYMKSERSPFSTSWVLILTAYAFVLLGAISIPASSALAGGADATPLTVGTEAGERAFQVELALTTEERMRGLMYRRTLAADAGMLFVWPESLPVRMWMKNTEIPLDMIFLDDANQVIHIERNVQPHDLTPRGPSLPARSVLEVAAGVADDNGIAVGDSMRHPALPVPTR